jgi:predicted transcriptional regulator
MNELFMKYRNSQQITQAVLSATQDAGMDGIKVTKLMVKSNLSYNRLGSFINKLTSSGLINTIDYDGKNTYIITEKGIMFLQEYEKFSDLAGSFGLEL